MLLYSNYRKKLFLFTLTILSFSIDAFASQKKEKDSSKSTATTNATKDAVSSAHDKEYALMKTAALESLKNKKISQGFVYLDKIIPIIDLQQYIMEYADCCKFIPEMILRRHTGHINCMRTMPDGKLVSCSDDGTICFWDTTKPEGKANVMCYSSQVPENCICPLNQNVIAAARWARWAHCNNISLWDDRINFCRSLEGHTDAVRCLCLLNNGNLASGSDDGSIKVWNTETQECLASLHGHGSSVLSLCLLLDGTLASGSKDGIICVWDTMQPAIKSRIATFRAHKRGVNCLCLLPDGRFASGGDDNLIKLWNMKKIGVEPAGYFSKLFHKLKNMRDEKSDATLKGHVSRIRSLCLLPDGRLASTGDFSIRLWDTTKKADEACVAILRGHENIVTSLCTLPHGKLASSSQRNPDSNDRIIQIWNPVQMQGQLFLTWQAYHELKNRNVIKAGI